jgi:hypothetical protein
MRAAVAVAYFLLCTEGGHSASVVVLKVGSPIAYSGRGIVGLPYSGDLVTERQDAKPGVARFDVHEKIWRDSRGRTREEIVGWNLFSIYDPVADVLLNVSAIDKVVTRQALVRAKTKIAVEANGETRSEKLGMRLFEGFVAEGTKTTIAGSAGPGGRVQTSVSTAETWFSTDLQRIVYGTFSDPKEGVTITRLINVSRAEPDAALFVPPAGFKVVDKK